MGEKFEGGVVLDKPDEIQYAQYAAWKGAVRLEGAGMKGRVNVTKLAREHFGLKPRTPHEKVIEVIQKKMDEMLAAKRAAEAANQ